MAALPDATLVYSGHEYAESNLRFALSVDAGNPALQRARDGIAACARRAGRRFRRVSISSARRTRSCERGTAD